MDYRYKLDYQAIARRIKEARKLSGLTQEQLAEQVDISTNAVAKLENNLMTASLQTLVSIANVLHLDFNDLLCAQPPDGGVRTGRDAVLDGLIADLSQRDKDFIIHVINGLKLYRAEQ